MDNITHSFLGLALGEAGLRRRTALATATLLIGANLPDVDGLAYAIGTGTEALTIRRGWTHGILAMVVLPLLLSAVIVGLHRLMSRRRRTEDVPLNFRWILALAAISIWSHPLLDLLNTYGVRLLMPFSGRWFYGDVLFIIDPWLWLALGLGVVWSRRSGRVRPARIALIACLTYVSAMAVSSRAGATLVERQSELPPASRILVSPAFVTPFRRQIIRDLGTEYERGVLTWKWRPEYSRAGRVPVGRDDPASLAASLTPEGSAFLAWARFPQFIVERLGDSLQVTIDDLRYADGTGRSWASVIVRVSASAP